MQRTVIIEHRRPAPEVRPQKKENFFYLKDPRHLKTLSYWLAARKYNTFFEGVDAKGHAMFGLIWDYDAGRSISTKRMERGLVVVPDKTLIGKVGHMVADKLTAEIAFSKIFRDQQRELYRHGRE